MSNKHAWLPSLALLAALVLPQNLQAYDSARLQAALESLGPTTLAGWASNAQAGDALAQNVLGMAYKYGIGTEQNHAVSLEWFRKAADQEDADAQFNLGRIYGKAMGTYAKARAAPQDDVEAVRWYRRSAEQDYRTAATAKRLSITRQMTSSMFPTDPRTAVPVIAPALASDRTCRDTILLRSM